MNRAQQVAAAAKAAGYTIHAWHGSTFMGIEAFDFDQRRFEMSERGVAWFTDNREMARQYVAYFSYYNVDYMIDRLERRLGDPGREGGRVVGFEDGTDELYLTSGAAQDINVMYVPEGAALEPAGYYVWNAGVPHRALHRRLGGETRTRARAAREETFLGDNPEEAKERLKAWIEEAAFVYQSGARERDLLYEVYLKLEDPLVHDAEGADKVEPWTKLVEEAREGGHDGVIVLNVVDIPSTMFGRATGPEYVGNVFGVFSPNQVKSAAPVTYDEEGDSIPLAQRFNAKSTFIRNPPSWEPIPVRRRRP